MNPKYKFIGDFITELLTFLSAFLKYLRSKIFFIFYRFEHIKSFLISGLTVKRGKYVQPFLHTSMIGIFLIGMALAPAINTALAESNTKNDSYDVDIFSDQQAISNLDTKISIKPRDTVVTYTVQKGDTVSSIAKKFNISEDTIRWQNHLKSENDIKVGQKLELPPTTGVVHKVKRGDTIYSIAKKYNVSAQAIVNWPYNTYTDDETFGLAVGQSLMVPDGVMPKVRPWSPTAAVIAKTPNAGSVSPSGQFIWPTSGVITQYFRWYHQAIDIANPAMPPVLAADSGTVIVAGWPDNSGYGNRVMIDHGNGFVTLYAHLNKIYVTQGQTVNKGDQIGQMGTTGRSTGTHLHFEIRHGRTHYDPLKYLGR